ncbi:MAG: type II secretion system protein GspJ [Polyangiaceae bacterium]
MSVSTRIARRARARGLTLIEVIVALGIMALVSVVLYGAFDGMARTRTSLEKLGDRYQQGRSAISRISRELQSAFISLHEPLDASLTTRKTLFVGRSDRPADRVDFTSFSHLRVNAETHESDQNELSYFGSPNPNGGVDLVRRESKYIDADPQHGGVVQVLAEDVQLFKLEYLDGVSGQWNTSWDTTQLDLASLRLPAQIRVELVLNRANGPAIPFVTKVSIPMQAPLSFGVPR